MAIDNNPVLCNSRYEQVGTYGERNICAGVTYGFWAEDLQVQKNKNIADVAESALGWLDSASNLITTVCTNRLDTNSIDLDNYLFAREVLEDVPVGATDQEAEILIVFNNDGEWPDNRQGYTGAISEKVKSKRLWRDRWSRCQTIGSVISFSAGLLALGVGVQQGILSSQAINAEYEGARSCRYISNDLSLGLFGCKQPAPSAGFLQCFIPTKSSFSIQGNKCNAKNSVSANARDDGSIAILGGLDIRKDSYTPYYVYARLGRVLGELIGVLGRANVNTSVVSNGTLYKITGSFQPDGWEIIGNAASYVQPYSRVDDVILEGIDISSVDQLETSNSVSLSKSESCSLELRTISHTDTRIVTCWDSVRHFDICSLGASVGNRQAMADGGVCSTNAGNARLKVNCIVDDMVSSDVRDDIAFALMDAINIFGNNLTLPYAYLGTVSDMCDLNTELP